MALVRRDPFARTELHKVLLKQPAAGGCSDCGYKGRLYMFYTETDGGTTHEHKGQFCNKTCHDLYHHL